MAREKKIYPLTGGLNTDLRFAVLGSAAKFKGRKHAWKAWQALKEFGCTVFPVAPDLPRLEGTKVFPDLQALAGKVDVVVPCLPRAELTELVSEAKDCGARWIWFQEQTWSEEMMAQCAAAKVEAVKGCVLRHKIYRKPWAYLHPCFWHGFRDAKVPAKRYASLYR